MTIRNIVVDGAAPVWAKHLETDLNAALAGLTNDIGKVADVQTTSTTGSARIGGLLLQWGRVATGVGDQFIDFPVPFTAGTIPTVTANATYFAPGNEGAYVIASLADNTRFYGQPRFENNAGVAGVSTAIPWAWMAIGI